MPKRIVLATAEDHLGYFNVYTNVVRNGTPAEMFADYISKTQHETELVHFIRHEFVYEKNIHKRMISLLKKCEDKRATWPQLATMLNCNATSHITVEYSNCLFYLLQNNAILEKDGASFVFKLK